MILYFKNKQNKMDDKYLVLCSEMNYKLNRWDQQTQNNYSIITNRKIQ